MLNEDGTLPSDDFLNQLPEEARARLRAALEAQEKGGRKSEHGITIENTLLQGAPDEVFENLPPNMRRMFEAMRSNKGLTNPLQVSKLIRSLVALSLFMGIAMAFFAVRFFF